MDMARSSAVDNPPRGRIGNARQSLRPPAEEHQGDKSQFAELAAKEKFLKAAFNL
jgi:hypothetical protein